jgi:hypothetical protein
MATLTIEGQKVKVDDRFLSLSPEEQADTVDEIASHLGISPGSAAKGDMRGGESEQPSTFMDMAKSIPGGLVKGVASIPGAIGDIPKLADDAAAWGVGHTAGVLENLITKGTFEAKPTEQVQAEVAANEQMARDQGYPVMPKPWEVINTQKVLNAIEPVTGQLYEPQTRAGRYTEAVASFAPAALVGGGSALERSARTVIPALASEGAGQATEGMGGWEATARVLGAIFGGGVAGLASRKGVPEQMVSQAMGNLDEASLVAAGRLMMDARQRGIDLTWPEAVQQVTNNGTRLGDLQRVAENSEGGGAKMRDFYKNRPQQIDDAAAMEFDRIGPAASPERIGPRVQQAAKGDMEAVNAGINSQTRPLYSASNADAIPANHPALADPAFAEAVRSIRSDPVLGPRFQNVADNSVQMIDAAQKVMRDQAEALNIPGQGLNRYKSSLVGDARTQVMDEAKASSPAYDQALREQAQLRDRYLNPLEEGPTGKLAATSDVGQQTRAMFPAQPQAGSDAGVARAMRGINRRDPGAAESFIRQHLETEFQKATQRLQGGPNQMGGAKFASSLTGNAQQRANLNAALRALPHGAQIIRGFDRFLKILEATGKRSAPNSTTAWNQQLQKELERGGVTGEATAIAASPQRAFTFISDAYKRFRLGRGTERLADLFTRGNFEDFRRLLKLGPSDARTVGIMIRLIGQIGAGANRSADFRALEGNNR